MVIHGLLSLAADEIHRMFPPTPTLSQDPKFMTWFNPSISYLIWLSGRKSPVVDSKQNDLDDDRVIAPVDSVVSCGNLDVTNLRI